MSRTMTKPKKLRDNRMDETKDERILPAVQLEVVAVTEETITVQPVPRTYAPPACSLCASLRPAGTNYSRVYGTFTSDGFVTRYIKCGFCNNTFKDSTPCV